MKFSEIPYQRLTYEETVPRAQELAAALRAATNGCDACEVYRQFDKLAQDIEAVIAIVYIRNHLNTADELYAAEQAYYDEATPQFLELVANFQNETLQSPFRKELEAEFGALSFVNAEIALRAFSPAIIEDLQEENRLQTQYTKLLASAQIEFEGNTYNLAQLAPFQIDPDRDVRRRAALARADWFNAQVETLDSIFDQLVALRTKMARKLGHDTYTAMGYDRRRRNCYGPAEVKAFRDAVATHIVPLAQKFKAAQAQRINVDRITPYDDGIKFKTGNATPIGTPDEILANGQRMYRELSPETAAFIDGMMEMEAFDVLAKTNKTVGGFCYPLNKYKLAFIFANFNGTSDDVETLTHEAGHAFAAWESFAWPSSGQRDVTYESAETHSMAMEFLTWPWMDLFYGDQTDKFKQGHLAEALTFLPYGVMVDEFQHIVYDNPELTPTQRCEAWNELEAKYRPWLDNDLPFYREGRRWQAQGHIYSDPFYYIDYCFAQANALSIWALAQQDATDAWQRYLNFVKLAATETFVTLTERAGLGNPFDAETLRRVADTADDWLSRQPALE